MLRSCVSTQNETIGELQNQNATLKLHMERAQRDKTIADSHISTIDTVLAAMVAERSDTRQKHAAEIAELC